MVSLMRWPVWTGALALPAGVHLRWKAIVRHPDGSVRWEPGEDRGYTVPAGVEEAEIAVDAR